VDWLERQLRGGLEEAGVELDEVDLAIIRIVNALYGPALRALDKADLSDVWPETVLDPSRPPTAR